jgi:hypothetical protein
VGLHFFARSIQKINKTLSLRFGKRFFATFATSEFTAASNDSGNLFTPGVFSFIFCHADNSAAELIKHLYGCMNADENEPQRKSEFKTYKHKLGAHRRLKRFAYRHAPQSKRTAD